jgi:hypothetical protein
MIVFYLPPVSTMATHPKHSITGEGQGGRRPGAGRPKGALGKRKRAREVLAQIKADGLEMPVDRLLRRMNDPAVPEDRRDEIAALVAPYTAPRLSAVSITKTPGQMSDQEISALLEQAKADLQHGIGGRNSWRRQMH